MASARSVLGDAGGAQPLGAAAGTGAAARAGAPRRSGAASVCQRAGRCRPFRRLGLCAEGRSSIISGVKFFLLTASLLSFRCELAFYVPRRFV